MKSKATNLIGAKLLPLLMFNRGRIKRNGSSGNSISALINQGLFVQSFPFSSFPQELLREQQIRGHLYLVGLLRSSSSSSEMSNRSFSSICPILPGIGKKGKVRRVRRQAVHNHINISYICSSKKSEVVCKEQMRKRRTLARQFNRRPGFVGYPRLNHMR